ncbi:MAG: hypothetical protein HUU15_13920 [Candidatus Brocadiae bacterium]|nr:hypothetical protein [Candidatus Brocadiia bacterium]
MSDGARKLPGPALFWVLLALMFLVALGVVLGREALPARPGTPLPAPTQ